MRYLVLLFLVSCGVVEQDLQSKITPKFKVGDCLVSLVNKDKDYEFLSNEDNWFLGYKVLKVGKRNYLLNVKYPKPSHRKIRETEGSIDLVDEYRIPVNCSEIGF